MTAQLIPFPNEDAFQMATARFLSVALGENVLYWHTPNGGARNKATAGRLKAMGTRAGIPDWMFLARGSPSEPGSVLAVAIELKQAKGRLSPPQNAIKQQFEALGGKYYVVRSMNEFEEALRDSGLSLRI